MDAYRTLIQINKESSQPVYVQLANSLIHLIRSGNIRPGARLPPIRELARQLHVHPKTVVAGYEELMAQDWVYSKPRSGIVVSENLPELKPRTFQPGSALADTMPGQVEKSGEVSYRFIINDGFPDYRLAPVEQLLRQYKAAFYSGEAEKHSMFIESKGSLRLRRALAKYLNESRGLRVQQDDMLLTRGAQMAIYLAAAQLIRPGDAVIVGDPGYPMANWTFEQLGARLIRIPVDQEGIDVDQLEKACKQKPRLLYIIPHHHHPTTVTLSAPRRMKLLSLIREFHLHVIEDDYDYEFHYGHSPILPLASADHGGYVWYIGSLTKHLMASMRLGYLIAPDKMLQKAIAHKRLIDLRGDLLMQEALAVLFENGTLQRHIRRSVKLYHQRRDMFCTLLEKELGNKVRFRVPDGGMAVWVQFDPSFDLSQLSGKAALHGLGMLDGTFYNSGTTALNALRMGFASLNEEEMINVFKILKKIMVS